MAASGGAWEAVIGLEIHAQLATESKIFCGAPTSFGDAPNLNIDPVTLGLPGALPVLNRRAVELAIRLGLAVGSRIDRASRFARKHYFYPDLPKGYQISQFEEPICVGGQITCDVDGVEKTFGLTRIHLEEDAGKNVHDPKTGRSYIDLNRAGTPLVEIVGEPVLRSPADAVAYMKAVHEIVVALGVSDGNMEQGNFRCDANVSVRRPGAPFGTRTEIKNVNSFRFVGRALEYEIARQIAVLEEGGAVVQETRGWDDDAGVTRSQRGKEEAHDYRYFPDPDLMVVHVDEALIDAIRAELPELPRARRLRFEHSYGLSAYDADVLTQSPARASYFEAVAGGVKDPKLAANWIMGELLATLNREGKDLEASPVPAAALAELIALIEGGTISSKMAKDCFSAMVADGVAPAAWVKQHGGQITDEGAIQAAVEAVLDQSPAQVAEFLSGKEKVIGYLVGQVMRQTRGKANPQQVNAVLRASLEARR
ncbi:MAG: Asp-tRNA(Asn)/Glu-tRNA(Gln) amidotransferase subunit GatB [Deltaproteobacteria bacterium]|nr:MAG: Asp-tRNA(Asn)/Glu-tRNA(Gln) amidotransferase subunit GatB [Deltaproteobacteria bacterium]